MTEQTFTRGGYPLSGDPTMTRHGHVGPDRPRCAVCNAMIFGDEDYLPNKCYHGDPHTYPNGERCPEIYFSYTEIPDGHLRFLAENLDTAKGLHCDGHLPTEIADLYADPIPVEYWAAHVVRPVVTTLLLPLLPFEYRTSEHDRGNPIRLTHIDGHDIRTLGEYRLHDLLGHHQVALPYDTLIRLIDEHEDLAAAGIPDDAIVLGIAAGLTSEEIATGHTAGALDLPDLRTLAGLRG